MNPFEPAVQGERIMRTDTAYRRTRHHRSVSMSVAVVSVLLGGTGWAGRHTGGLFVLSGLGGQARTDAHLEARMSASGSVIVVDVSGSMDYAGCSDDTDHTDQLPVH